MSVLHWRYELWLLFIFFIVTFIFKIVRLKSIKGHCIQLIQLYGWGDEGGDNEANESKSISSSFNFSLNELVEFVPCDGFVSVSTD
jgi:hypothetical protein